MHLHFEVPKTLFTGALIGFCVLVNVLFIVALAYVTRFGEPEPLGSKFVELQKKCRFVWVRRTSKQNVFQGGFHPVVLFRNLPSLALRVPQSIWMSLDYTLNDLSREPQLFRLCE